MPERFAGAGLKDFCPYPQTLFIIFQNELRRGELSASTNKHKWLFLCLTFGFEPLRCACAGTVQHITQVWAAADVQNDPTEKDCLFYFLSHGGRLRTVIPNLYSAIIFFLFFFFFLLLYATVCFKLLGLWGGLKQEIEGHQRTRCFWRSR